MLSIHISSIKISECYQPSHNKEVTAEAKKIVQRKTGIKINC